MGHALDQYYCNITITDSLIHHFMYWMYIGTIFGINEFAKRQKPLDVYSTYTRKSTEK